MRALTCVLLLSLYVVNGDFTGGDLCRPTDDCCHIGGTCISGAFDPCPTELNYRVKCWPSYRTCCLPKVTDPPTVKTTPTRPAPTQSSTVKWSTTQASTTQPSTTQASTTQASTTQASTTQASTTQASTTQASTTQASTTQASTTQASTTQGSTTQASTTHASTTQANTTQASTVTAKTTPAKPEPTTEVKQDDESGCHYRDECCKSGGTCIDGAFDPCATRLNYRTKCNPTYLTCCESSGSTSTKGTTSTEATDSPSTPSTVETSTAGPGGETTTVGTEGTTSMGTEKTTPAIQSGCGQAPLGYIVSGREATPHSWPWAVSLYLDYFGWNDWKHHCTGSLIDNQFVVTAAHCIAKSGVSTTNSFKVVLGGHDQSTVNGNEVVATLEKWIVHEDYSTTIKGSPNDIAILKLSEPITFNQYIQPICLPDDSEQFTPSDSCYILGWGETLGTGPMGKLNEVSLNITTNADCDYYWEKGSGRVGLIKESHICVGMGVPGACRGDSGGPLICKKSSGWTLAGCTSFGAAGCQEREAPNVYTRITSFMPWIRRTVANN
ncbi:unnamed protein product [Owenia fusiformis]|uniref:Uncharacterized protein n=1 Tax=Owenia fusiformis TaxID=6347 RepID=A0A8J1Y7X7_OWEFU|nr:unnamed protein product [Owenia fusiformis]